MAGLSQMLQHEFINYRNYTNRKLQLIEEKMDYFTYGMNELLTQRGLNNENFTVGTNEEDDVQWRRRNNCDKENEDRKELKHLNWCFHYSQSDNTRSCTQDCDSTNCEGAPIYDEYDEYNGTLIIDGVSSDEWQTAIIKEAPVYDCPPTFDATLQCERNCVFDDKAEFIYNIQQGTTQPEYEEDFCYNEVPVFDNIIGVEQGLMKRKGVSTFIEQQQVVSLVRKLSSQPHMMQLRLEGMDIDTNITTPNGPKPYTELFDKMRCGQGVVCHLIQSKKEWFASLEPWRDKVETSSQNIQLEKTRPINFSPYAYPKYVETTTGLFLQPYNHSKFTTSFANKPSSLSNKHDNQIQFPINSFTFLNNLKTASYLTYENDSDQKLSRVVKEICYNEFNLDFLYKYMDDTVNSFKEAMMNKSTCIFLDVVLVGDYIGSPLVQKLLQDITIAKKFYKSNDYGEGVQVEVLTGKSRIKVLLNQEFLPLGDYRRYSLFKWKMKENKSSLKTCVITPLMQHFYLVMFSPYLYLWSKKKYLVSTCWRYLIKNSKIDQFGVKVAWKNLKEKSTVLEASNTWRLSPAQPSSSRSSWGNVLMSKLQSFIFDTGGNYEVTPV